MDNAKVQRALRAVEAGLSCTVVLPEGTFKLTPELVRDAVDVLDADKGLALWRRLRDAASIMQAAVRRRHRLCMCNTCKDAENTRIGFRVFRCNACNVCAHTCRCHAPQFPLLI